MLANQLVPLGTAALGFACALLLGRDFARSRRAHHLAWAVGMVCYGLAGWTEFAGGRWGWSAGLYRLWYASGAVAVAAWLGLGTLLLLTPGGFAWVAALGLAAGSIPAARLRDSQYLGVLGLAAFAILALVQLRAPRWAGAAAGLLLLVGTLGAVIALGRAPVDVAQLPRGPEEVVTGRALPGPLRLLTPIFNVAGAACLVGGAALSAWRAWSWGGAPGAGRLAAGNALVAAGAFVPTLATSAERFGVTATFYAGQLLGLALILAGVVVIGRGHRRPRTVR